MMLSLTICTVLLEGYELGFVGKIEENIVKILVKRLALFRDEVTQFFVESYLWYRSLLISMFV